MKRILVSLLIVAGFASCSKDSFESVPRVSIASFGPSEVNKGEEFQITATVTDNEGDIKRDSAFLLVRKTYLQTIVTVDTLYQDLTGIESPTLKKFDISASFVYGEIRDERILQNYDGVERKISIGVIVVDEAGNRSNYAESDQILLKKL